MDLLLDDGQQQQPQKVQRLNGLDLLTEDDRPQQPAPELPAKPQPSWWQRNITGVQDEGNKGLPGYMDLPGSGSFRTVAGPLLGASDEQMTDLIKTDLGDRFLGVERDSQNAPIVRFKDEKGAEQRAYVNVPGLDVNDVARGTVGAIPYVFGGIGASILGKGSGLLANMGLQGAAAGTTSVAGDLAQLPLGSEQGVELPKAAAATVGGLAGPAVGAAGSALWRKFVTIPGMVDSAGNLTAKGVRAAQAAGLDPADLTPDAAKQFAKMYAESGDASMAAVKATTDQFQIPATQGQITKRPKLLNQEEKMRRGLYGDDAENMMRGLDQEQRDRIQLAMTNGQPGTAPAGMGRVLNPARGGQGQPRELGASLQEGLKTARETAKQQENALWETGGVKTLEATDAAMAELPAVLQKNLQDVLVDTEVTPTAAKMAREIDRFIGGEAPEAVAAVLPQAATKSVDRMRRRLLSFSNAAASREDERATQAIYDSFNEWITTAAEKNLLAGDAAAAAQLVGARGFSKEVRQIFNQSNPRLKAIMDPTKTDSGEAVIQQLLGAQGSRSAMQGAVSAVKNIKTALDRFGGQGGKEAWDDIRLAYWLRLVQNKSGEVLGPQALASNIKSAFNGQGTLIQELFTKQEIRQMKQLVAAMERLAYKPPNASGSGYTAAEAIQELTGKFLNLVPGSSYLRSGLDVVGVNRALGARQARQAVSGVLPPPRRPNWIGGPGAVAAQGLTRLSSGSDQER